MRDAGMPKRRFAVWVVVASVVVLFVGLVAPGHIRSRLRFPVNPLGAAITAYQRHYWGEAARLARARLETQRDDADASRLLARATLRLGNVKRALEIYKSLGDEALAAEDF